MKKSLLVIILMIVAGRLCALSSIQNSHTLESYKYDSLSNITFHRDINEYRKYIGQSIVFCKKISTDIPGNPFALLSPDTVWLKKKRKSPVQFKDYIVNHAYCAPEGGPYRTIADSICGKIFEITSYQFKKADKSKNILANDTLLFTLTPIEHKGISFNWVIKMQSNSLDAAFPCYTLGYLEKLKNQYVNKKFVPKEGWPYSFSEFGYDTTKLQFRECPTRVGVEGLPVIFTGVSCGISESYFQQIEVTLVDPKNRKVDVPISSIEPSLSFLSFGSSSKHDDSSMSLSMINNFESYEAYTLRLDEEREVARRKKQERVDFEKNNIEKFGTRIGSLINVGVVVIGMTKEQCLLSWGYPDDLNKTTFQDIIVDQWIYTKSDKYLYFTNGKLTTMKE